MRLLGLQDADDASSSISSRTLQQQQQQQAEDDASTLQRCLEVQISVGSSGSPEVVVLESTEQD